MRTRIPCPSKKSRMVSISTMHTRPMRRRWQSFWRVWFRYSECRLCRRFLDADKAIGRFALRSSSRATHIPTLQTTSLLTPSRLFLSARMTWSASPPSRLARSATLARSPSAQESEIRCIYWTHLRYRKPTSHRRYTGETPSFPSRL